MDAITAWINGPRDYAAGVELYLEHGRDPLLRRLFTAEDKSPFKEKKLLEALGGLQQHGAPQQPSQPATAAVPPTVAGWGPVGVTDPVLAAMHAQWKPLYQELMTLQASIYEVAGVAGKYHDPLKQQQACDMAHRILDLDDQLDQLYHQRDQYLATGTLPGKPVTDEVTAPHTWPMKLANAQRYVREYAAKVKKDPGSTAAAERLVYWQGKVDYFKKLLKLD